MIGEAVRDTSRYDVAIIGSGFTGSLLGQILAQRGFKVALIDPVAHPRFAVGESSTPLADGMLKHLGQTYDLPRLIDMATWGGWQRKQRHLVAGKKRGFSYFVHEPGNEFTESTRGQSSLLVAASPSDERSDTHWMRCDVDAQWHADFCDLGGDDWTGYRVVDCVGKRVVCQSESNPQESRTLDANWIVDASGGAGVLARLFSAPDLTGQMQTRTRGRYAHFDHVASWSDRHPDFQVPFDADDAAQHHLLGDRGWMWMLRFAGGRTSVGLVQPIGSAPSTGARSSPRPEAPWPMDPSAGHFPFPSVASLFADATRIGAWIDRPRLQRWTPARFGPRHLAMPTAAATIDPLHSTGIAHGLVGVDRVARMILGDAPDGIPPYADLVAKEVRWIDHLVATAYDQMGDFARFSLATLTFVLTAITSEERLSASGNEGGDDGFDAGLYGLGDASLVAAVTDACRMIQNRELPTNEVWDRVRGRLAPWNHYGLFDRAIGGRYAYTATKKVSD